MNEMNEIALEMRSLWSNKNGKDRKKSATLVVKPHRSKTYNIFLAFDCVLMQKGRHPMLLLFVLDQTDQRVLRCPENGIFTVFKRAFVFETTNKFCGRRLNRKPAMCSLIFNSNFRLFPIPIIEPFCDFERKYNFRFSVMCLTLEEKQWSGFHMIAFLIVSIQLSGSGRLSFVLRCIGIGEEREEREEREK